MREIDDVLRWRPDLDTLVGEAEALQRQLARQRGTGPREVGLLEG